VGGYLTRALSTLPLVLLTGRVRAGTGSGGFSPPA